jgi:hypothetical protein
MESERNNDRMAPAIKEPRLRARTLGIDIAHCRLIPTQLRRSPYRLIVAAIA